MNYGFVIDNNRCIGCHACSTACKSENSVPLGVNRTWVKYVETGIFPSSRRHFQVTRCNHCANPPCVRICPVTAMYQRDDGIVEFDPRACIGCKACLQACPYDAIYIDPEYGTAAKCHFCTHRLEVGLEPACVVVCPVHAIIAGDMDDTHSEISHVLSMNKVTVRKPEQGTAPKLFYINADDVTMHPTATERAPETYMWADVIPMHETPPSDGYGGGNQSATRTTDSGVSIRSSQTQGTPLDGPIQRGGQMAEQMVQVAYNAQHKIPWHWQVPAYLVTKGIGAGIFLIYALSWLLGGNLYPQSFYFDVGTFLTGGFWALVFIAITTGFLVFDLEQPQKFLSILLRPQWKSWLARGAYLLVTFSAVLGLWWLFEFAASLGFLSFHLLDPYRGVLLVGLSILALYVAIYTAFLFGQAEGRDLWQSSLLPIHLIVQALMAGSAAWLLLNLVFSIGHGIAYTALYMFFGSLIVDLIVTFYGEFGMPHASEVAAAAAHKITHGHYKHHFWWGNIVLGHLVPIMVIVLSIYDLVPLNSLVIAGITVLSIIGLYLYEYAFVMAPQEVPNS